MALKREGINLNLLVEEIKEGEKTTAAGIIVPDTGKQKGKVKKGKVVETDPASMIKPGDIVYYRNGMGMEVTIDDKPLLIIKSTELALVDYENTPEREAEMRSRISNAATQKLFAACKEFVQSLGG